MNISYKDRWSATKWKKERDKCIRSISADIHLYMWFMDEYDFEKNPEYNWWQNFWRETIPSYIAGDGASFWIAGSLQYDTSVKVQQEK